MTWCSYAACHEPAAGRAEGWDFCRPHLRAHEQDTRPEPAPHGHWQIDAAARRKLANYRRSQIARLWRKGWTDAQIGRSLGLTRNYVGTVRRSLGLAGQVRTAECGTRSGYQRHRQHGEAVCDDCRQAQRDYDRVRWITVRSVA